jgi:hypothetical protein
VGSRRLAVPPPRPACWSWKAYIWGKRPNRRNSPSVFKDIDNRQADRTLKALLLKQLCAARVRKRVNID